jgi:uncharacterized membrane protein
MKIVQSSQFTCVVCAKSFPEDELAQGLAVRTVISDLIRRDHPAWSSGSRICRDDLARYSMEYLESLLQLERGEFASLGKESLRSLQQHGLLAANVEAAFEKDWTLRRRLADRLAKIGSSRTFGICFGGFLVTSIITNAVALYWQPANPYPLILINLLLASFAAVQAPVLAFSQTPHGAKDRLRWEHNYIMTLKAELGVRQLTKTVDDLAQQQRQLLIELQQTLLVVLSRPGKAEAQPQPQRPVKSA